MLRLRHAIVRASRRRKLGLLVVLCLAFLLAVLVFHSAQHGIDEGAALTCAVVVLIGVAVRSAPKPLVVRVRFEPIVAVQPRSVVAAAPPATESPPGFTPLRL